MIAILLVAVLMAGVAMGCCQPMEAFENATPMKKTLEEAIKDEVGKAAEAEEESDDKNIIQTVKEEVTKSDAVTEETKPPMNNQEKELFEQITNNSLSNDDLKKLIGAGILTEKMVEKFLNKIDEGADEKIEGFCSGGNCYASIV